MPDPCSKPTHHGNASIARPCSLAEGHFGTCVAMGDAPGTIEIYTSSPNAKCVWRGSLPFIPRAGDFVTLDCGLHEPVDSVTVDLATGTVRLTLATCDPEGDYPQIEGTP